MNEVQSNEDELFLAVYGTLKEDFPNYFYYLHPRKPIYRGIIELPFQLYTQNELPILFPSEKMNNIYLEIFQVTEKLLTKIDRLEDVPNFYSREKIFIKEIKTDVFIYVVKNKPYGEIIEDGNYKKQ